MPHETTPDTPMLRTLLDDLHIKYEDDAPLGPLTWYNVGGHAQVLAHPETPAQLGELVRRCHERGVPMRVLGSGANLLVREGVVPGVTIRLDQPHWNAMQVEGHTVRAGAGYDLHRLVIETAKLGLDGLAQVAGIPASIGGAVRMNAGGTYGDVGQVVKRVQVMSATGQVYYRDRDDLDFTYRSSNIDAPLILEAEFELQPDDAKELLKRVKEIYFYKTNSQPFSDKSAGCCFKNPPEDDPHAQGRPAGMLIDQAGLKGFTLGTASVSEVHANFFVADKHHAKAEDVYKLMQHVQAEVQDRFGVHLEREVVVWP
ncbi:MAG: UDP-N-acetylmuramate dehydrogenase [Phycisphaerales bacterium JB063]